MSTEDLYTIVCVSGFPKWSNLMFDSDYLTGNGNGGNLNEKDSSGGMSEMASPTSNNVVLHDLEEQQKPQKPPRQPTQGPQQPLNPEVLTTASLNSVAGPPVPMSLISWSASHQSSDKANSSCVQLASEHETQLKNLTLVNILILVVLIIVFIANAKEGKESIFFFFYIFFRVSLAFLGTWKNSLGS